MSKSKGKKTIVISSDASISGDGRSIIAVHCSCPILEYFSVELHPELTKSTDLEWLGINQGMILASKLIDIGYRVRLRTDHKAAVNLYKENIDDIQQALRRQCKHSSCPETMSAIMQNFIASKDCGWGSDFSLTFIAGKNNPAHKLTQVCVNVDYPEIHYIKAEEQLKQALGITSEIALSNVRF